MEVEIDIPPSLSRVFSLKKIMGEDLFWSLCWYYDYTGEKAILDDQHPDYKAVLSFFIGLSLGS